jgi:hypothetical protein
VRSALVSPAAGGSAAIKVLAMQPHWATIGGTRRAGVLPSDPAPSASVIAVGVAVELLLRIASHATHGVELADGGYF